MPLTYPIPICVCRGRRGRGAPATVLVSSFLTGHHDFSLLGQSPHVSFHLTCSLREPGGPCTKSMEVSESRMERVKIFFFFSPKLFSMFIIEDFCNVFKFHAYSVNKRLFLTTAKLVRGLSDVATTNVCKVDTSNSNHIERSRWMKWLIAGLRQKKYPLIWIKAVVKRLTEPKPTV